MFNYKPSGVCSSNISFDIFDNKVINVNFKGGCAGNLIGISKLAEGKELEELISLLKGIDCSGKGTSCPDQFSKALEEYKLSKK